MEGYPSHRLLVIGQCGSSFACCQVPQSNSRVVRTCDNLNKKLDVRIKADILPAAHIFRRGVLPAARLPVL
mgnify:CR=1 FL=1